MGTKTFVSASAMHLVDASATPVKDAILTALLKGEDVSATILKSLLNGMGNRIRLAHKYAQTSYPLGLPQGETLSHDPINNEELSPYILAETGYPYGVLVTGYIYTAFTPLVTVYAHLLNERGYQSATGVITVWPVDLQFTPIPHHNVNTFPREVKLQQVRLSADGLSAEIVYDLYVWRQVFRYDTWDFDTQWVLDAVSYVETVTIPDAASLSWDGDCLLALYYQLDAAGATIAGRHTWVYQFKDNLYPELHPGQALQADEYMPVIPIRHNNVDFTDAALKNNPPDPTNLFSTSKKLLKKLSMDFEQLGSRLNANPGIADIDHAYIMWGVDVQTDFAPSLYYLTEYFDNLRLLQNSNELTFLEALNNPNIIYEPYSDYATNYRGRQQWTTAPDTAFTEHGLVLNIQHDYITTELTVGTIGTGKIGYAEKIIEPYTATISTTEYDGYGTSSIVTLEETRWRLVLRAQVLVNQVKTTKVHNLVLHNFIYGNYSYTTSLYNVLNDPDEHNLVIPIQYNLASKFPLSQRNVLYADSSLLMINSVVRVKLKWYQTGWFKCILIIVAVIVIIYTWGTTAAFWAGVFGLAAGSAAAIAVAMLMQFLVGMLINMLTDWIVTQYGDKIGVLAVILTIAALVLSKGMGLAGTASQFMMTTAQAMLQISTALISSVNEFLVEQGQKIYNEYEAFIEKLDGLWEEVERVQDLLEWKSDLDPLMFARPARLKIVPNESPTVFYSRCLSLPENTMFTIHDEIPQFIGARLQLPKDISADMYAMNTYS